MGHDLLIRQLRIVHVSARGTECSVPGVRTDRLRRGFQRRGVDFDEEPIPLRLQSPVRKLASCADPSIPAIEPRGSAPRPCPSPRGWLASGPLFYETGVTCAMPVRSADRTASRRAEEKAAAVRRMFGAIAPRYDLLNHLLSLNIDRRWRRRTVDWLLADLEPDGTFLDACAGTLDLALELAGRRGFRGQVIASDFSLPMLERGRPKIQTHAIRTACADALCLPFPDQTFDGATVGFGVRNLADLDAGLNELARVLRPGGRLVILEFTTPVRQPLRGLYLFYFRKDRKSTRLNSSHVKISYA